MIGTAMSKLLGLLERGLSAQAEDADLIASLAQISGGHGALCFAISRQRRKCSR